MTIPVGIPNCPPGLEYLTLIDQLLVKQKVNLLEVMTGFEQNNKFTIKNALGQNVRHNQWEKYVWKKLNIFSQNRCTGQLRIMIAAQGIALDRFVHLIWKSLMFTEMRLFISIVRYVASLVSSLAVCSRLKYHHLLET